MSTGLFNIRKLSRPLFVLLGLLSLATGTLLFSPQTTAQSSGTSGRCDGAGPCTILHVKLEPHIDFAVIVLTREKTVGRDDEFFLYNATNDGSGVKNDGKTASSGDVIWGSNPGGALCHVAPQPDTAYFSITVRGVATGTKKHINMCSNESPKAADKIFKSDSGEDARVKTITVDVTTRDTPSKKGGISGSVDVKGNDGKTVKCESSSAIDITNKKNNEKTHINIGDGKWDTGLTLDPGKYDVLVRCQANGRYFDVNYKDVNVKAGETTKVGAATCTTDSENGKCDAAEEKDDVKAEEDLCPIKSWEFRWAACPIVSALYGKNGEGGVMGLLQDWGVKNLAINIDEIFGSKQYYAAWNSFRVIAVSLIIVAGLIMVVSQAANMEIFDTYTIRKLLPRLLIVAIIIAISWWLLEYIVLFFNNLMIWVGSAIEAPFNDKIDPLSAKAMAAQIAAVIVASTLVNPAMIISYLTTITLAWAVATLALAVRKMIIIFFILTSPIFLFFAIFNGTQKLYKTGQTGLISLLAIGIVFNGALELGHVMAELTPAKNDPFGILRLGFQIAGLLVIPVALMRLGGMASTLTGLVNDRSKGAFDKLKNGRAEQRAGLVNKMKTGDRWKDSNLVGGALNKVTRGAYDARNAGLNPMAMKRRYQASADQGLRTGANNILASDEFKSISEYDDALKAGRYKSSAAAIAGLTQEFQREGRTDAAGDARRAVAAVESTGNTIGNKSFRMAAAMQRVSTGTGYKDLAEMSQTLAEASDGNVATAGAVAGWANFQTKKVGRNDLAPGAGKLGNLVKGEMGVNGVSRPTADSYIDAGYEAMMGASNSDVVRMKTGGITHGTNNLAAVIQRSNNIMNSTGASTAQKAKAQEMLINATAKIDNAKAAAPYGSETNILAIQKAAAPVQNVTNEIKLQAAPTSQTYDIREQIPGKDAAGNTIMVNNPRYGKVDANVRNTGYDAGVSEAYGRVVNSRGGNPYDDMNMRQ
jgi:hypothetical protein